MREPVVLAAIAVAFYGFTQIHRGGKSWLAWLGVAGVILALFHAPTALVTFVVLFGLWFLEPARRRSWKLLALFSGILVVGVIIVLVLWSRLPSLQGAHPLNIIFAWLQSNSTFQSGELERASGIVQNLFRTVGERWKWLVILVYGVAQPVLPAVVGDPGAAGIMRIIGFFRAAGWYALAPFLVYGLIAAFRTPARERRAQLIWLGGFIWVWTMISAYNAGGDQWDNPRYRAIFLVWQAVMAAWAWDWARTRRDAWLWRWLAVETIFVLSFTEWYVTRYTLKFAHTDIKVMIVMNLVAAGIILGAGWFKDKKRSSKVESRDS
jgi:hypothetical protein